MAAWTAVLPRWGEAAQKTGLSNGLLKAATPFTAVGLISSLGNIGPLVIPVVFGLLIDFTGTFHASVFSVATPSGITFVLSSRLSQGVKLYQKHPEHRQRD
jgi:nitrate/nitrite transporter NarK